MEYRILPKILNKKNKPPKYIQLDGGTCLRYKSGSNGYLEPEPREYYRDAGQWSLGILVERDGDEERYVLDCSMVMNTPLSKYHLTPLYPCSKEQWQKDNAGYI